MIVKWAFILCPRKLLILCVCVQEVRLLCIIRVSSVHWRVARLSYLISRFICKKKKIAFYPRKQRQENSSKFDHWRSQCVRAPFFNNPDIQFYTKPHTIRRLHHTHHTSFVPIRSKHPPKHTQFNVLCKLYKLSFFVSNLKIWSVADCARQN